MSDQAKSPRKKQLDSLAFQRTVKIFDDTRKGMEQDAFFIPKQKDESLLSALTAIMSQFKNPAKFFIRVTPHHNGSQIDIKEGDPLASPAIQYVLSQHSEIMPVLRLVDVSQNQARDALTIERQPGQITDKVTIHWNAWAGHHPNNSAVFVELMGLARKHLRAVEVEAGFSGVDDTQWSRYRDSQQLILNSLEETAKSVLVESNRRMLEVEAGSKARYEELEKELRQKFESERNLLGSEHDRRLKMLDERENAIQQREKSFNTKEGRFVARQGQQKQIEDLKESLGEWTLTKGTKNKWLAVTGIYVGALLITGILTFWLSSQSFQILKSGDLTKIPWWQWVVLSLKSILPLAAFTTFLVYFIRWSSAWARQHAEEEFRNRARVLDIGRSAWLLEAVRDAQDNQKELPVDLVKELSRNLFTYSAGSDGCELYPEAISEMLMQGLSSLRVKSHDGTEIEAKRGKEK